jgi:radical SAM protein with 4Fe4S-binding SPASM domain
MCPRDQLTRKIGNMSMDVIKKLCRDAYKKPLQKINLFGFGESLLHPHLIDIIKYVKKSLPDVELNLSTNGQLLDDELSSELLVSGIDKINIDIDGVTKETYESVRKQLKFEKVSSNIGHLIDKRNKLHAHVEVSVTIIEMDLTKAEIEPFQRLWTGIADIVYVNHYNTWTGILPDRNTPKVDMNKFAFPCKNPWREMIVNYNGNIAFCCMDFNSTIVLGNIMEQTIEEIWRSEKMEKLRQLHLQGRYNEIPICGACNEFVFQSNTFWANLFQK